MIPWLAVVILPLLLFGAVAGFDFVHYDDDYYVYENANVMAGLSAASLRWAFAGAHYGNYNPLTWLSHLLDATLFGAAPAGHHLHNLALHIANSALVLALARRVLPAGAALFVAASFAVHPQHVESVAWVSDRKDLLAALWALAAVAMHGRWAARRRGVDYAATLGCFAAAMLSKPTVAPLPVLLLLLDVWPLQRWQPRAHRQNARLMLEKVPMLLVAVPLLLWASTAQRELGALVSDGALPWPYRLANAVVGVATYAGKLLWPSGLAVHYPHPGSRVDAALLTAAAAALLGISVAAWRLRRSLPLLAVGWFGYLLLIAPVAGLVQLGSSARADRFVYLPLLLLLLAVAAVAVRLLEGAAARTQLALAGAAVAGQVLVSATILPAWRDTEALMRRACAVTEHNALAHTDLGMALERRGDRAGAEAEYQKALQIEPMDARANNKLGNACMARGDSKAAVAYYQRSVQTDPSELGVLANLSIAQELSGDLPGAEATLTALLDRQPTDRAARLRLANVLLQQKRLEPAYGNLTVLLDADPGDAEALDSLGNLEYLQGHLPAAARAWQRALAAAKERGSPALAQKIAGKLGQLRGAGEGK
ncbi:MAG: tetratricopeptide repeat protein [Deltaproteobacteria bacterium]|nr:tetratricopeptide repeat protein [Deltaproteobacteria bacterium]